jgi:fucose 4-O-acetylase-like acetyltransferase
VSWDDRPVRERSIDLYRAFAILAVVVGHWLAFALRVDDGRLTGENLVEIWPPAPWLTWFFQVMPLFFVVGGYGNAASWSRQGTGATAWIGARLWRLLLPSLLLLAVASVAAVAARAVGAGGTMLDLALAVVGLPLWFLAVYVVVVATTPWLVAAERSVGLRLPLALLGACLVVDVLANHVGVPIVGWSTYAFFWLGVYSVGICWRSGALLRHSWLPPVLAAGGALGVVLLTTLGPYPVSMLAAPGERIQNNGPPSAALVALALAQIGLALLLRHRATRWCDRRRVWAGVVAVNLSAMSIYLWHMVAALGAALLFWRVGLVEAAQAPAAGWWLQRPLWYLVCTVLLVAIVAVVRPLEARRPVQRPVTATPARGALLAIGVLMAAAGMVQLTVSGLAGGPAGLPVVGLGATVLGMLAVRWAAGIEASAPLARPPAVRPDDRTDAPLPP